MASRFVACTPLSVECSSKGVHCRVDDAWLYVVELDFRQSVALDSHSLKCERASGPSHGDDGGGDALQGISFSEGDRSSSIQSERFRAGVDRHNVDTIPGGF
jgi:hypothetical protein